ncbi:type II secretion system F family protein [Undibacterium sp. Jales W-56]|uniref:type II secretion system F family protein n=1 Tax=Undibacterium sp. Jales W-56 TaxID=2897325 RepID=UPI0021D1571B|nr:type II secretion system F family protein [Undibacterium sp. Jales W-56]MCU6433678.1 type II secretion system F family protein [Undibacterium sp. Jales W-56]
MRYQAKVMTVASTIEEIEFDSGSETEARHFVESSGVRLLSLKQLRGRWNQTADSASFNLTVFNQQLYSLLDAGQPIVDAIQVLGLNDKRGKHRGIYDALLLSLRQGHQLSDAMAGLPSVFPQLYVAMVRSSETTGTVRASIKRFMQYQYQVDGIRAKLKAAMTYPLILLSVGFLVISFLLFYVVPRFSIVFEDVSSPNQTSMGFVQLWGGFVRHHSLWAWSGLVMVVFVLTTIIFHPGIRTWISRTILKIPVIGERVWVLQLARLYRTLSMLLHSGVSVLTAMKMTEASLSDTMKGRLHTAAIAVSEGHAMSKVMSECELSTEVAQRLLLAGESSGNLDEMMERIADFYDQEVAMWIDAAGRIIEPVLMVGIGLIVGVIVLMLYSPIFDLANAV